MSLQARTVLNLIAGALGGFLAWIIIDLTGWFSELLTSAAPIALYDARWWQQIFLGGIVGSFVGLLLGLVNAIGEDSTRLRLRGIVVHGAIGFAGGGVGLMLGQSVWAVLAPRSAGLDFTSPGDFLQTLVARAVGWAFIGAGVGLAQGIARRSPKLIRQGLFGGFVGGLIGGILFQCAATIIGAPTIARLLGFVSIGASAGFFIGLIQTLFRQAWVRVVLGRNEGKEYLVDKPVLVIGRSELADIGLFGNPRIMPHQCAIEQIGGRYRLKTILADEKTRRGTIQADVKVNGQIVSPDVWLTDGDTIVIDDRKLQFREKLTKQSAAPVARPAPIEAKIVANAIATVAEGPEAGRQFSLTGQSSKIGRTEDCAIQLPFDTLVSRHHATITNRGATWSIADNGSANGTYVNGVRLTPGVARPLLAGDVIKVGLSALRIEW